MPKPASAEGTTGHSWPPAPKGPKPPSCPACFSRVWPSPNCPCPDFPVKTRHSGLEKQKSSISRARLPSWSPHPSRHLLPLLPPSCSHASGPHHPPGASGCGPSGPAFQRKAGPAWQRPLVAVRLRASLFAAAGVCSEPERPAPKCRTLRPLLGQGLHVGHFDTHFRLLPSGRVVTITGYEVPLFLKPSP